MSDNSVDAGSRADNAGSLTEAEIDKLLDYLLFNKMVFTQNYLQERDLPFSGTKMKLRERLTTYLASNVITPEDLLDLLNRIEGWGAQHIYLFQAPSHIVDEWRQEVVALQRLTSAGLSDLINRKMPLLLPQTPTLCEIQLSRDRLRFDWVETRYWEERVPEQDRQEGDLILRAYRTHTARGVITFELDLISGKAMLMIRQLPRGTKYEEIRDRFLNELESLLATSTYAPIRVSRAIQALVDSGKVRRRQLGYESQSGSRVQFLSPAPRVDVFQDSVISAAAAPLRGNTVGSDANFYWLSNNELEGEVHSRIYGGDQRVAIFGQHTELAVRHVLSQILRHC